MASNAKSSKKFLNLSSKNTNKVSKKSSKKSSKKVSKKSSWTEYTIIGQYLKDSGEITPLYRKSGTYRRFYLEGEGYEKVYVGKGDSRILK